MTVSSKSTKAQLLQHIEELNGLLIRAEQEVEGLRKEKPSFNDRLQLAASEARLLVLDVYHLGAWCRKGCQPLLDALHALRYTSK